jgi:hypothetical protein
MTLHERIAEKLGWTVEQTQSFSLQALRTMVRTVSPKLAHEISLAIRSDVYIRGPKYSNRRRYNVW